MKTIEKLLAMPILKCFFLAVFFITLSCSDDDPEPVEIVQKEPEKEELEEETPDPVTYTLSELSTGSSIKGANGINFGSNGNLYIASFLGSEIIEVNKENGDVVNRFGRDMGLTSPDDLVFGPDGSLYWTDTLTGEVGRMTNDGVVTKQFVGPGVNPITFSDDGRLFVALCFTGDGLYELDPNLMEPPRPIIVASEANPFPLGFLNGFDFGPDGRLYGPLYAAGLIVSIDVDRTGDPISDAFSDGSIQVVAGGFVELSAVKFDSDGMLTALDLVGEVFKVDTMTGETTLFAELERGMDNLAFDTDGNLYISNADAGWVIELLSSGEERTISNGGFIAPQGLAVLPGSNNADNLFVADLWTLRQLDTDNGQLVNNYGGLPIPQPGSLSLPQNLSVDGNNLIISSWFGGNVQVWNPQDGVTENYTLGAPQVFGAPIDAVRLKDDIAINDIAQGAIVWASDNSTILPIDGSTLALPGGLESDGESLWLTDWVAGTILRIDFEDRTPSTPVIVASGLVNPEGLALDDNGNLVVVEWGASRLSRIDLSSGEVTMLVDGLELHGPGLEGYPPTWLFDAVTIGQFGDIYVSGGGKNVIYKITKD